MKHFVPPQFFRPHPNFWAGYAFIAKPGEYGAPAVVEAAGTTTQKWRKLFVYFADPKKSYLPDLITNMFLCLLEKNTAELSATGK